MNNFNIPLLLLLILLVSPFAHSQNEKSPWQVTLGATAIDLFPVGSHASYQGNNLQDFFNVSEHWNISSNFSALSVSKNINNNYSVAIEGSFNSIRKWGSEQTDDLMYFNLSSYLKYNLSSLLKLQNTAFEPFFGLGGGYTWIEKGPFNAVDNPGKDYSGNFSVNGTVGLSYWFNESLGLTLQTTYNHVFANYTDKSPQHYRHLIGLSFRFANSTETN
jgi:outer membrane protein W